MSKDLRRRLMGVALGVVAALPGLVVPASEARSATRTSNVLQAGDRLVASTANNTLRSASGEFELVVLPDLVSLDQFARMDGPKGSDSAGTDIWFRDDAAGRHQSDTDRSTLTLRRNGNLVLATRRGVVLWSTHTAGSGPHNRLILRNNGNLVIYTARGEPVWASHTTRVFVPAGTQLASGQRLVSRWGDQRPNHVIWSLTMQTDGDLVLRCAGSTSWQSRTHVRGSYVVMQHNGNLVIRGPHGYPRWSSHTAGSGPYTYLDAPSMQVFKLYRNQPIWAAHIRPPTKPQGCGWTT